MYFIAFNFLCTNDKVSAAAIPAIQVATQAMLNIRQCMSQALTGVQYRSLQERIGAFREQSQRKQSLDFNLMRQLIVGQYDVNVECYNNYLLNYIVRVPSRESKKSTEVVAPAVIITPRMNNDKAISQKQQIPLFLQFPRNEGGKTPSFPIVNNIPAPLSISISTESVTQRMPNSMIRYYNAVHHDQARLLADGDYRNAYTAQINSNISLIHRLLDPDNMYESLKAQSLVHELKENALLHAGNILLHEVKPRLIRFLFPKGHFKPIDTPARRGEALAIIAPYMKACYGNVPEAYIKFLQGCKQRNIPGADLLLARVQGTNGFFDSIGCWFSNFGSNLSSSSLGVDEKDCAYIQDFKTLEKCCLSQDFDKAREIIDSYQAKIILEKESLTKELLAGEKYSLQTLFDHCYDQAFTHFGVRWKHTDDPYYHVAEPLLQACGIDQREKLNALVKATVSVRQEKVAALFNRLEISSNQPPLIKAFAYALIEADTPQELIQILKPLSLDHQNNDYRKAYQVFCCKGLPRLLTCNQAIKEVRISSKIEVDRYADARHVYQLCASIQPKTMQEEELLKTAIKCINRSIDNFAYEKDYLLVAQKIYQELAFSGEDQVISNLPLMLEKITSGEEAESITILKALVCGLSKLDAINIETDISDKKVYIHATLKELNERLPVLDTSFNDMQKWLEKVTIPTIENSRETDAIKQEKQQLIIDLAARNQAPASQCQAIEEKVPQYECGTSGLIENDLEYYCGGVLGPILAIFPQECLPLVDIETAIAHCENPLQHEIEQLENMRACNWSTYQGSGSSFEIDQNNALEKNEKTPESIEKEIQTITDELKQSSKTPLTHEDEQAVEQFRQELRDLIDKYDVESVKEAFKIVKIKVRHIVKEKENTSKLIEWLSKCLKKINSNPLYRTFKYDAAHNNMIKISSIEEAMAGIACLEQKLLETIKRSPNPSEEFIEDNGSNKRWDVKTARSHSVNGLYIWNVEEFISSLKEAYAEPDENIILQITGLNEFDLEVLYKYMSVEFTKEQWKRTLIVHADSSSKSHSSKEFVNFMEKICQLRSH